MITPKGLIIFAVMLTLAAYAISANVAPPLATTIAGDLGFAHESFGIVFGLQFTFFALGCFGGGWLSERFGLSHRRLLLMGLLGMAVTLACGSLVGSFAWLVIWALPLGLAGGLTESFSSIMICDYEGPSSSKLINLSQVFFCLGAMFGPQMVSLALAAELPWRRVLVLFAGSIAIITVVFVVLTRRTGAVELGPTAAASAAETAASALPLHRDLLFYLLGGFQLLYVAVETSAASWTCVFFERQLGVSVSSAAWRPAVFWGGVALGRSLILILPKRWTQWPAAFCGATGMMIASALMPLCESTMAATVLVLVMGVVAGPLWPVGVSLAGALRRSARFTSGVIACGALGAALGPLLSAYVIKHLGLARLFPASAVGCVPLLIALGLAYRHAGRKNASTTGGP